MPKIRALVRISRMVNGGITFMPRSKSIFGGLAMLTCIEHHTHREGDAAVYTPLRISRHVEHVTIKNGQLAIEFADDVFAAKEDEVRPHECKDWNSRPPQEREDDRVFFRDK